jgi:Zinc finger C-x8-C-x5-C-x3-H type (and similar)
VHAALCVPITSDEEMPAAAPAEIDVTADVSTGASPVKTELEAQEQPLQQQEQQQQGDADAGGAVEEQQQQQQPQQQYSNKRPCMYHYRGSCKHGDACTYDHTTAPQQCKWFLQGRCRKGRLCTFAHDAAARAGESCAHTVLMHCAV